MLKSTTTQLVTLLRTFLARPQSERELALLFHHAESMACAMLHVSFPRQAFGLERQGYTERDVAQRCVEDLFLPREGVACAELRRYFETLALPGQPDEEWLIAFRRIVSRKVHQTLQDLARERDPHYARVLRNVHDVLREEDRYRQLPYFNETLVLRVAPDAALLHEEEMPHEILLRMLLQREEEGGSTSRQLNAIFDLLESQTAWRRACSLLTICAVLKDCQRILFAQELPGEATGGESSDDATFEVRDLIETVVRDIDRSLLSRYSARGELQAEERAHYCQALSMYLSDIVGKGPDSLFSYFAGATGREEYEAYRRNGRNRFEYIMRAGKDLFIDGLKDLIE